MNKQKELNVVEEAERISVLLKKELEEASIKHGCTFDVFPSHKEYERTWKIVIYSPNLYKEKN